MAERKSPNQKTIDKAGPTKPMSKGVPGKAPSDGVQSTAEAINTLERSDYVPPRTPNSDQG